MKLFIRVSALSLVAALSGCSPATNAIVDTARSVLPRVSDADGVPLNPNFRYLRVTINGRVALLVLGFEDRHPQGAVEVWYSSEREVLRLQDGRLAGAVGVTTEWRNVVLPELPRWSAIARTTTPVAWVRVRDVMPGYRFGIRDALRLRVIPQPAETRLRGIDPTRLAWFEEESEPGANALPSARYGVELRGGKDDVVYGEQCLAPELCFAWQRWPAGVADSSEKK